MKISLQEAAVIKRIAKQFVYLKFCLANMFLNIDANKIANTRMLLALPLRLYASAVNPNFVNSVNSVKKN